MLRKIIRWIALILGCLLAVLVLALVVLLVIGTRRANRTYDPPVATIPIPVDAAAIQRGRHLAVINMCTDCHTDSLGGQNYFTIPGMLTLPTPNLTRGAGGLGASLTDQDWLRALRHGVGHDGRALIVMPSNQFYYLSDQDLGDIIAYAKSLPPVDTPLPPRRIELLGRLMMGAGLFPPNAVDRIDHTAPPPPAPPPGVTAAYGQYLSHLCTECHGANLNGAPFGPPGDEVPTPNLTRGGELAAWSEQDFITTLRQGVTPGGHQLNEEMPWQSFGQMTDAELQAVWRYLQSLPPLPQGG